MDLVSEWNSFLESSKKGNLILDDDSDETSIEQTTEKNGKF